MSRMHKKIPYIFNTESDVLKAKQEVEEKYPQLRTSNTETFLFIESRNSILFDEVVERFIRSLGGMPKPAEM